MAVTGLPRFRRATGRVPCARLHTRLVLAEWGLTGLTEQAELIVSELVTNAVAASQPLPWARSVWLWLRADSNRLLIAVWDANPQLPVRSDVDELAEHGRGLLLVDSIAADWDAYPTPDGAAKSSAPCARWTGILRAAIGPNENDEFRDELLRRTGRGSGRVQPCPGTQ